MTAAIGNRIKKNSPFYRNLSDDQDSDPTKIEKREDGPAEKFDD